MSLCMTFDILDDLEKLGQGQIDLKKFDLPHRGDRKRYRLVIDN